jgi:hypothetical protein
VRRGELYLVQHPSSRDPRKQRVSLSPAKQALLDRALAFAPGLTSESFLVEG